MPLTISAWQKMKLSRNVWRQRAVHALYVGEKSPLYDSSSPRDEESWKTLCQAAEIQHFQPIIHTAENSETNFSNIKYHRDCRSNFTHKKKLLIVKKQEYINEQDSLRTRHSTRQASSTQSRVYDTICIFCQSKSKYIKGTNSREPLKPAVELRADKTIRDIATELQDDRIWSITVRDIVAAEAHSSQNMLQELYEGTNWKNLFWMQWCRQSLPKTGEGCIQQGVWIYPYRCLLKPSYCCTVWSHCQSCMLHGK